MTVDNKVIHYIWLGGNKKSKLITKCLKSWKKHMPDWQIVEWNESNLDMDACAYCKEAYNSKKYAFASDFLRFSILEKYGGLYLDVDVEMKKSLQPLLDANEAFTGFEYTNLTINPGLILYAKKPNNPVLKEMVESYLDDHFEYKAKIPQTVCERMSNMMKRKGFMMNGELQTIDGFTLFPSTYFCPVNKQWTVQNFSKNTYTIHYYGASWLGKDRKSWFIRAICKILGPKGIEKVKKVRNKQKK